MDSLPSLHVVSIKIPVSDLAVSRRFYTDVFALREVLQWPDEDGTIRGVALAGTGDTLIALREDPAAAVATRDFGFVNLGVPDVAYLAGCAAHLDALGIAHTGEISGADGRLVGFHDPDHHELSFYARTHPGGVRNDASRAVTAPPQAASTAQPSTAPGPPPRPGPSVRRTSDMP